MANVDFDMTVQQTVINVTDQTGETFEVTPQPKVEVSVAEGSGGGGGSIDMDLTRKMYSARFEQNSDGDNTWTMVMPVVSGVIMNEDDTVTIQM